MLWHRDQRWKCEVFKDQPLILLAKRPCSYAAAGSKNRLLLFSVECIVNIVADVKPDSSLISDKAETKLFQYEVHFQYLSFWTYSHLLLKQTTVDNYLPTIYKHFALGCQDFTLK